MLLLLLCSGIPSGRDQGPYVVWEAKSSCLQGKHPSFESSLHLLAVNESLGFFLTFIKINLCYSPISYWTITFWRMFKQDSSKELIFKDCWPCKGTKESKILELLFPWTEETVLFCIRYLFGFSFSLPVSLRIFKTFHFQSYNCSWLFLSYDFWS